MNICIIISIVLLNGCAARATLAGGRLHPDLEQTVHVRKGQGVSLHVRASSSVTLPNFRQCLRLCWYISACADVSYDSVTKACRLFSTTDHSAALSAVRDSYGQTFASVLTADRSRVSTIDCLFVCWLVGCLTSQQHASVFQGRFSTHKFTCCHTETEFCRSNFPPRPVTVH